MQLRSTPSREKKARETETVNVLDRLDRRPRIVPAPRAPAKTEPASNTHWESHRFCVADASYSQNYVVHEGSWKVHSAKIMEQMRSEAQVSHFGFQFCVGCSLAGVRAGGQACDSKKTRTEPPRRVSTRRTSGRQPSQLAARPAHLLSPTVKAI